MNNAFSNIIDWVIRISGRQTWTLWCYKPRYYEVTHSFPVSLLLGLHDKPPGTFGPTFRGVSSILLKGMLKIHFPCFLQIFPDLFQISPNIFPISTIIILREWARAPLAPHWIHRRGWIIFFVNALIQLPKFSNLKNLPRMKKRTQTAHDVETTLYGRCNDIKTLKWRRNNVILTSCVGWERT